MRTAAQVGPAPAAAMGAVPMGGARQGVAHGRLLSGTGAASTERSRANRGSTAPAPDASGPGKVAHCKSEVWANAGQTEGEEEQHLTGTELWNKGSAAHAPQPYKVVVRPNAWEVKWREPGSAPIDYVAGKIAAAAEFIGGFQHFSEEEKLLTSAEREQLAEKVQADLVKGRKKHQHQEVPCLSEPNPLDDSITQDTIRSVCNEIYDDLQGSYVVGSIEAALMAMDLTSEIRGAWRIPATFVTARGGRVFSYVCVLVHYATQVAVLGRSTLQELCYIPLEKRKTSDAVDQLAHAFRENGHEIRKLILGLPSESAVGGLAAARPIRWRYLKMSCNRQEWASMLLCCDLVYAQRSALRRVVDRHPQKAPMPRGFAALANRRSAPRLKAAPPALVRKQRVAKREWLPPLGTLDPKHRVSEVGVWQATEEELLRALYGGSRLTGGAYCISELEDYSSVSSDSLEDYAEDRLLGSCPSFQRQESPKAVVMLEPRDAAGRRRLGKSRTISSMSSRTNTGELPIVSPRAERATTELPLVA